MAAGWGTLVKVTGNNVNTVTTGSINTTTGDSLVVSVSNDHLIVANTPTDNKSAGGWTAFGGSPVSQGACQLSNWYKENATGGSGHTATATFASNDFPVVMFGNVVGGTTNPVDTASRVNTTDATSPYTQTSNAFAQADTFVVAWIATDGGANPMSYAEGGGTYTVFQEGNGSSFWSHALAYKNVSATTAQGVSWTHSGSSNGGAMQIIGFKSAAAGGTSVNPGVGSVAITGQVPTVARTANQSVTPGVGTLSFTGQVPTVARTDNQAVVPGVGALTFTGYAPTISQSSGVSVNPSAGAIAFTGYAPTIAQPQSVNPGAGSLSFTGYAPSIAQPLAVAPGSGAIAFTGYAPTLAQTANQALTPGAGALVLTGYAPTVTQVSQSPNLTPDVGALTITGYAPGIVQSTSGGVDSWGGVYVRKKKKPEQGVAGPPPGPTLRETIEKTWAAAEQKTFPKAEKRPVEFDDDEDEVLMLLY